MLSAAEKLQCIRDMCRHPGAFHWTGREMADAITRIIDGEPINYRLSELDEPIPFQLVHDAVYEEGEGMIRKTVLCAKGHPYTTLRPSNYTGAAVYPPVCPRCAKRT